MQTVLQLGRNVLAVRIEFPAEVADRRGILFDAQMVAQLDLDVPESEEVEYKLKQVTQRAVVCDLCAELHNQQPACVNACPHDAARRVNAWADFPTR